jgi:DNA-binding MarR family transcriptional regulator
VDFDLETFLPYKLSVLANTLSHNLAQSYVPHGLNQTQWRVMAVLSGVGDMPAREIARKTVMDKTTISRAIKDLISRKLVRRKASQHDGRTSPLALTAKGLELVGKIEPAVLAYEAKLDALLSLEDRRTLDRIVDILLAPESGG